MTEAGTGAGIGAGREQSLAGIVAALSPAARAQHDKRYTKRERDYRDALWLYRRRAGQASQANEWSSWLVMAGRGFGKTRLGAEWVQRQAAIAPPDTRIALVGATLAEARAVMVEGESGVLNVGPGGERPRWSPATGELRWPSGALGRVFSAERPEGLRGPTHAFAWCDEIAKWPYAIPTWDNLRLGLRQGERPRVVATTTPRPVPLVKRLLNEKGVWVTGGATAENPNLPPAFVDAVTELYGGTRLGRQELSGELIDEVADALWTRARLEDARTGPCARAALQRVVVGVDPPASQGGDACGIVAVGLRSDGCEGRRQEGAGMRTNPNRKR